MADLLPVLKQRFFDSNGAPLAGGKLYSYVAGTTSPAATYTDQTGTVANTNPIILDSNGYADVWIKSGSFKFILKDASDVLLWTVDNVQAATSSSGSSSGSSGSSGINYIGNPNAETDTSGWATYADAAGTSPVDGTGGSPNSTWTRTTSSPLRGSGSFLYTHNSGPSRQGEGVSYDFTIDTSDKAKVLQISFDYLIASGTFVAGSSGVDSDLTIWIYDVTNATLIQPSNYKLLSKSSTIADKFNATFQTASNSTSYRLIIHNGTFTPSAFTVMFDNFNVGPSTYVYGSPVTDWVSYTPTVNNITLGTGGTITGLWRRVGDTMEFQSTIALGTGGSFSTSAGHTLPIGYSVDLNKLTSPDDNDVAVGSATGIDISTSTYWPLVVEYTAARNQIEWNSPTGLGAVSATVPWTWAAGDVIKSKGAVPITGWSSSVQMSDQADTRVVDWVGYVASNQAVTANVTNIPLTSRKDSHGGWGGSSYTVIVPGDYSITGVSSPTTAVSYYTQVYVNGVVARSLASSAGGATACGATVLNDLKAGDVISFRSGVTLTVSADTTSSFTITRISGPVTIAESEAILVSYGSTAGSAIGTSYTLQTFTAKEIDTHGCWNGTDTFTAQTPANYRISAGILTAAVTLTTAQSMTLAVYKNGSLYRNIARAVGNGASIAYMLNGDDLIPLKQGETLQVYAVCSIATSQSSSGAYNRVSITRVG